MNEIIERLKHADGPNRELDEAIYVHLGAKPPTDNDPLYWTAPGGGNRHYASLVPWYTSSVDAALKLVPKVDDNRTYVIDASSYPVRASVWTTMGKFAYPGATAAIALCIASLRAMASTPDRRGGVKG